MADESRAGDVFNEERLCRLIELMKEHDLEEIDLQEEDQRICLRRNVGGGGMTPGYPPQGFQAYPAPAPPPSQPAPAAPVAAEAEGDNIVLIKSPMVGTFYAKPNPNSPAYVKVGDHVDPDKTICMIEAMKVFNEIPAEITGQIVAVLIQNEEPIEFGTPLFKVDTQG